MWSEAQKLSDELFLKLFKLENVPEHNLPNQAWAGPDKFRRNALHKVVASTLAMVIHVLYVWTWATRFVFPSYWGMVSILKLHGGMVSEILTRNGDWVSDRTSQTGSGKLRLASSRSIYTCIWVKRSSSGVARPKGPVLSLLLKLCPSSIESSA